jgi:hypothetical protein
MGPYLHAFMDRLPSGCPPRPASSHGPCLAGAVCERLPMASGQGLPDPSRHVVHHLGVCGAECRIHVVEHERDLPFDLVPLVSVLGGNRDIPEQPEEG